ncbi:MAG: MmgE/PrpD family protein [Streptosporangiaceae bacterium]
MTTVQPGYQGTLEERLADLAVGAQWTDLPQDARGYAEALAVDALANAIAGRTAETVAEFEAATTALSGPGRHAVCGGRPLAAWAAAGQNAYQMTVHTMCDVYRPALCHVTPEVVPAALAAAELAGASGSDFLLASALGLEVTTRVCLALDYPAFRARGWHSPGVAGAIGAAAAAGRLLGLSAAGMTGCLGLAGAQAAGTFAAMGTVAVKFHQANGARAGLSAALYAAGGFAGSRRILTAADGGILASYSGGGSPDRACAGLGRSWELRNISMRAYPGASTLQALVDCLLSEQAQQAQRAGQVTGVTVWLPPHAYRLGSGGWDSQLAAMQSARFVAAAVLHLGDCWLDTFGPDRRDDPAIAGFASRSAEICQADDLEEGAVRVRISGPGCDLELARAFPRGDCRDPLSAGEVRAKAARCIAAGLPQARSDAALAVLTSLGAAPDIGALARAVTT